ncbi:MAG: GNAT family N-acetyltransferase [Pseudomonadota bacterium]
MTSAATENDARARTEPAALRPLRLGDAARIQEILSQKRVTEMLAVVPWPYPKEGGEDFVRQHVPTSKSYALILAITDADAAPEVHSDGEAARPLVGLVSLRPTDGVLRLGYYVDPSAWGRGLATSACRLAVSEAFRRHPATTVEAGVFEDNPGSIRVLEKLGFRQVEGKLEECVEKARPVASRLYRLTPDEWVRAA